jgi:hypothetical protein
MLLLSAFWWRLVAKLQFFRSEKCVGPGESIVSASRQGRFGRSELPPFSIVPRD